MKLKERYYSIMVVFVVWCALYNYTSIININYYTYMFAVIFYESTKCVCCNMVKWTLQCDLLQSNGNWPNENRYDG